MAKASQPKTPSNLDLWNSLAVTPAEATKQYLTSGGTQLTAIDPIYRAMRMTEIFGPAGQGWSYNLERSWREEFDGRSYVFCQVSLQYMSPTTSETCIIGPYIGGSLASVDPEESYKSAITDALGKCMSLLGLAADVYAGKHTVPTVETKDAINPKCRTAIDFLLSKHGTAEFEPAIAKFRSSDKFTDDEKTVVERAVTEEAG